MVQGPGDPTESVTNPPSEAKAFSLWQRSWETDEDWKEKLIWGGKKKTGKASARF